MRILRSVESVKPDTWLVEPEKADGQWRGKMVNASEKWLFQIYGKKDNRDHSG